MINIKTAAAFCAAVLIFSACSGEKVNQLVTEIEAGEEYDATHFVVPADENASISVKKDDIDINKPGKYEVLYELTSETLKYYEASIFVTVKDTTPPVFNEKKVTTDLNSKFDIKKIISVKDIVDGDVSDTAVIEDGEVNIAEVGEYEVTVKVNDKTGNTAKEKITVCVEDMAAVQKRTEYVNIAVNRLRSSLTYPDSLKINSASVCEPQVKYEMIVKLEAELKDASGNQKLNSFYIGVNNGKIDNSQFTNNVQSENIKLWKEEISIKVKDAAEN